MSSIETIIAIILLILVGYISKRIGLLKYEDSITLNKIVVNIAIPSLIFLAMYTADLSNIKVLIPITLICISNRKSFWFTGLFIFSCKRILKKNEMDIGRHFNSFQFRFSWISCCSWDFWCKRVGKSCFL